MTEQKEDTEHIDLSNAILTAAKNGITEMVESKTASQSYPVALYDVDQDRKNIVLLIVEHKQPHVYEVLLNLKKKDVIKDIVYSEVDCNGDSALHLAAKKANFNWPIPGPASQMQWEIKCDHVPFNSHIRVQRKRFPSRLTREAFAGFISILPVYSNYLDMFHNSTLLHLQGSTDIYIFLVICNGLPAVNSLCYVSVSALLSFGVSYLYECATT
ncbi:isoform 4 of serine/threonine-protein phosphatase 6 regulatory ankyrin repeat subunit a [Fagus crenata]